MTEYNLNCPKGYGNVKFIVIGDAAHCPISNRNHCVECDIVPYHKIAESDDWQVKREEK